MTFPRGSGIIDSTEFVWEVPLLKKIYDAVDRFCARHPRFGIPNLMRYIVIGTAAVYILMVLTRNNDANALSFLSFNLNGRCTGRSGASSHSSSSPATCAVLADRRAVFLLLDRLLARARVGHGALHALLPQRRAADGAGRGDREPDHRQPLPHDLRHGLCEPVDVPRLRCAVSGRAGAAVFHHPGEDEVARVYRRRRLCSRGSSSRSCAAALSAWCCRSWRC